VNSFILVLLGGGLGSGSRYVISTLAERRFGSAFAWGTLLVNLAGCLLIGFAVGIIDKALVPRSLRVFLVSGFLGGFTTFSSFSLESIRMFQNGAVGKGLANIGINVVLGLALTLTGMFAANRM